MKPTPEQQHIIEHRLEPLRVTAGAGTGKTQTMTMRLAHLVTNEDIAPEEALGITFTNKAAEELADRLRRQLPDHVAEGHEVQVQTYHGFAHSLIREFGPLLGLQRELRVIPPGYARQLLRDSLGAQPRSHLDLTRPGYIVDLLQRLLSSLGDHLLDPSAIPPATNDDPVTMQRFELAEVLAEYQARKRALGAIDYPDMVVIAHRLVSRPEIAQRIRDRYRVVLLDEYQDTNPGQRELLRAVFGGGFPVTAVGDPDQTIYEWRGASPANFADFPHHFPVAAGKPAPSRPLSTNWRSGPQIIEVANQVRDRIVGATGLDRLSAREGAGDATVRTHWLRTAMDEAAWIADDARRLHDEEGHAWRDIAILFRKHRQMPLIRDALVANGIPVEVAALGGLLEVPEVADLHAWLRVLGQPEDDIALARLLTGAHHRLGLGDLAPLARWAQARRRRDDDESTLGLALLEAIDHLESIEGLSPEARRRLDRFATTYRQLLGFAQTSSLAELCRRILDATGAWPEVDALDDVARLSTRLNLYRFLDLAESWSPLEHAPSLIAFLDYLDLLSEEGAEDSLDTANVSGEDAVLFITVHRAKGLEWPVVYLPALCRDTFPSGVVAYEDPVERAEVLPHAVRLDTSHLPVLSDDRDERRQQLRQRHDDQEWRAAYVAVTRARDELIATGAFWYSTGRAKAVGPLFEIIDALGVAQPDRATEPGEPPASVVPEFGWSDVPDPVFEIGWQGALAAAVDDPSVVSTWASSLGMRDAFESMHSDLTLRLEGLPIPITSEPDSGPPRVSVTGAVTFASCAQRYYWSHVDRLPRRPSPAARHGVEVHRRIERLLRGIHTFDDLVPGSFDGSEEGGSPGHTSAMERFSASRFAAMTPILVEAPFSLDIGGARVDGRIDAVYEPEPGLWEVVDFKSGRASDDPTRRVQLQAYAVAVTEAGFLGGRAPERVRVTFAFLGGDSLVEISEEADAAWIEQARADLRRIVERATAGERTPTPSEACRWCDFSRFCEPGTAWLTDQPSR